jgi:hypothetical protein
METEHRGMPIFLDQFDREIADALPSEEADVSAWHPSNAAAHKLWRCLECLRDLDELLGEVVHQKNATKRKRRLKIAITPLHSLTTAIDDLLNDIQSNKETSNLLKAGEHEQVIAIKQQFGTMLPHDHKAPLSIVRNKLSSHIDKGLQPSAAQELGGLIVPSEFGRWLHICLHLILDLTKLDIYWWSCEPPSDEYVRFMSIEPFIVTFRVESRRVVELAALHIAKRSPRNDIPAVVDRLITNSVWMFKPGQARIGSLKEDKRENWNTFLGNLALNDPSNN